MSKFSELPDEVKPYEKCLKEGPQALSDEELMAVFIRLGTPDKSPVDIARDLISLSGGSLVGILDLGIGQLKSVKGIGEVKAVLLSCICELSKRLAKQSRRHGARLQTPDDIADYYMERLRHERQEQVWVCAFDTKLSLIGEKMISLGTVSASMISPAEVFRFSLNANAASIILVHNHPSGDPTPSRDDIDITNKIYGLGVIMNIRLLDHVIIGDRRYVSLHRTGVIKD